MAVELEPGAVIRSDGKIVSARLTTYGALAGWIRVLNEWGGGPPTYHPLDQEGVLWARGEWGDPDVVALRALAALGGSR